MKDTVLPELTKTQQSCALPPNFYTRKLGKNYDILHSLNLIGFRY